MSYDVSVAKNLTCRVNTDWIDAYNIQGGILVDSQTKEHTYDAISNTCSCTRREIYSPDINNFAPPTLSSLILRDSFCKGKKERTSVLEFTACKWGPCIVGLKCSLEWKCVMLDVGILPRMKERGNEGCHYWWVWETICKYIFIFVLKNYRIVQVGLELITFFLVRVRGSLRLINGIATQYVEMCRFKSHLSLRWFS